MYFDLLKQRETYERREASVRSDCVSHFFPQIDDYEKDRTEKENLIKDYKKSYLPLKMKMSS